MQDSEQKEIEDMARRFRVSPDLVKVVLSTKRAQNMREKTDAFEREKALIRRELRHRLVGTCANSQSY